MAVLCCTLAACGSSGGSDIAVRDPWFRAPPPFANTAALYAVIENETNTDDSLVAINSSECRSFELHRTITDEADVASMEAIGEEGLRVGAGETLVLEPGGLHGMCLGLLASLDEGDVVVVDLEFDVGGTVRLSVPVERR